MRSIQTKNRKRRVSAAILLLALLLLLTACSSGGQGVRKGYTKEVAGHWEQTYVSLFGPKAPEREKNGVTIRAGWNEDKSQRYTFADADGRETTYTVAGYWFSDSYYPGSYVQPDINIIREGEGEPVGDVIGALCFGDVEPGGNEYGVKITVRSRFRTVKGEEIGSFSIGNGMTEATGYDGTKYYLNPSAQLPVGQSDGEKLYMILGTMDGVDRSTRMYTVWEYTWVAQPETIEVPDEYGPIEYGPETRIPLLLIPLILLIIVTATILRIRSRRRNRNDHR